MSKNVLTLDTAIAKEIEYRIEVGIVKEGDRLPSERSLAEEFGVQRGTVRAALKILQDKGFVQTRSKSGNFVAMKRIDFDLSAYNSRKIIFEKSGKTTNVKLMTFEKVALYGKAAVKMHVEDDTQVFKIMRLRYANNMPIALERTHIMCDLAPGLTEEDVHEKSIYRSLRQKFGIKEAYSESRVTAAYANGLESELLNLKVSHPVLRYEGRVYDRQNRLIEYFDDIILKDKVQFINNEIVRR